jgi:hypothetical protein
MISGSERGAKPIMGCNWERPKSPEIGRAITGCRTARAAGLLPARQGPIEAVETKERTTTCRGFAGEKAGKSGDWYLVTVPELRIRYPGGTAPNQDGYLVRVPDLLDAGFRHDEIQRDVGDMRMNRL